MTSQSAATLRSRYAEQAATDLEDNRRLQQELAEKIKVLKQEEILLTGIMNLAERHEGPSSAPPAAPEQVQGEPVPAQRKQGTEGTAADKPSRPSAPVKKSPAKSTASKPSKAKSPQPLLGDVLLDLLRTYNEPRLAKELRDELLEKHPDRTPTPQVVRNTLEALVAKGRIRRHKQQRSVMYSPSSPPEA